MKNKSREIWLGILDHLTAVYNENRLDKEFDWREELKGTIELFLSDLGRDRLSTCDTCGVLIDEPGDCVDCKRIARCHRLTENFLRNVK